MFDFQAIVLIVTYLQFHLRTRNFGMMCLTVLYFKKQKQLSTQGDLKQRINFLL